MTTARPRWTLSFLTLCDGVGLFCYWSEWIVVGQCSLRGDQLGTRNVIAYRLMVFVHHQKRRENANLLNLIKHSSPYHVFCPSRSSEIHAASSVRSGAPPKILQNLNLRNRIRTLRCTPATTNWPHVGGGEGEGRAGCKSSEDVS